MSDALLPPDAKPNADQPTSWEEYYNSPKADLLLISSDQVGFRVDSFVFAKRSTFVNDLLNVPSEESLERAPILVDQKAVVVRSFIDLVMARVSCNVDLNTSRMLGVYKLGDRFQVTDFHKSASLSMRESLRLYQDTNSRKRKNWEKVTVDAWAIFKLAAQHDDPALAKAAIRSFDIAKTRPYDLVFGYSTTSRYADVPRKYAFALMRVAFEETATSYGKRSPTIVHHLTPCSYARMAENFRPG